MINPDLHKQLIPLDREQHRALRLRQDVNYLGAAATLSTFFVTAAEFADTCKDYPILFLEAGQDDQGRAQVAPVALFGLSPGENLFFTNQRWDAHYVPAALRAYPFTMAKISPDQYAVCIDQACPGLSTETGTRLFDEQGNPSELLGEMHKFVEQIEIEVERTRRAGQRLLELGLLRSKRFEATLPDGTPMNLEGFLAVDEEALAQLPDAQVVELHRSGLLGMVHTHQVSLGNMRRLIERRLANQAALRGQ